MEGMYIIMGIICMIFGIFQIILFFKIWGMTNNVKEMKEILKLMAKKEPAEPNLKPSIPSPPAQPVPTRKAKQEWAEHVTEEEKNKAQSIIPKLMKNEVIIKLTKNGKMVVYEVNDLHELAAEEYKLIYQ